MIASHAQIFWSAVQLAQQNAMTDHNNFFAYYHGRDVAWLAADYVAAAPSYINSPLTDDLKTLASYSLEIYGKAVRHCWNVLNMRARSLAQRPQMEAWRVISDVGDGSVDWLVRTAALPATAR